MENNNELQHWGIKGMKWGVRRYRNPDGSLTPAGKKRYNDGDGSDGPTKVKMPSSRDIRRAEQKAYNALSTAPGMITAKRRRAKVDKYLKYEAEAERLKSERARITESNKKELEKAIETAKNNGDTVSSAYMNIYSKKGKIAVQNAIIGSLVGMGIGAAMSKNSYITGQSLATYAIAGSVGGQIVSSINSGVGKRIAKKKYGANIV